MAPDYHQLLCLEAQTNKVLLFGSRRFLLTLTVSGRTVRSRSQTTTSWTLKLPPFGDFTGHIVCKYHNWRKRPKFVLLWLAWKTRLWQSCKRTQRRMYITWYAKSLLWRLNFARVWCLRHCAATWTCMKQQMHILVAAASCANLLNVVGSLSSRVVFCFLDNGVFFTLLFILLCNSTEAFCLNCDRGPMPENLRLL